MTYELFDELPSYEVYEPKSVQELKDELDELIKNKADYELIQEALASLISAEFRDYIDSEIMKEFLIEKTTSKTIKSSGKIRK